jgi:hypothetical protein
MFAASAQATALGVGFLCLKLSSQQFLKAAMQDIDAGYLTVQDGLA